jgi:serine/threonine protein kinase/TolB-like protein/lipoprotein NlpI
MTPERYQEVGRLCRAALKLEPAQRAAYLGAACGDEDVRREVESLLGYETEGFLDQPPLELIAHALAEDSSIPQLGEQCGHYRLLSLLGKGGMGKVYLAHDPRLERQVAIKMLPAEFTTDAERVRRFEQEARAASALNHPNIITIHEIGESAARHYVVMEYVAGQTLRQLLTAAPDTRLEPAEALKVAVQVAAALEAAHDAGITHRDMKPENVMVRADGLVKVIDFGLAKLSEARTSTGGTEPSSHLEASTASGMILGTPSYMSPEQARGEKVDTRTDIFNLGVLFYEMLAGHAPFAGATASDVIAAILRDEPAQIPGAEPELQSIVRQALQKERTDRYPAMRDMLADLTKQQFRFLMDAEREASADEASGVPNVPPPAADAPLPAAQETWGERARRAALPLRWKLAWLSLLVAVAGLFGSGVLVTNDQQIASIAILPFVNASGNADLEYLSDGLTETLIRRLAQLPKLSVKARSSVFRYKGTDTNPAAIGAELNVQAVLNGRVMQRGEQFTLSLELVDVRSQNVLWSELYNLQPTNLVLLQSEITRDVASQLKLELSGAEAQKLSKHDTEKSEAYRLYLQGRYYWLRFPEPSFEKSRVYYQQAIEADPNYALAYAGLSEYYGYGAATGFLPPDENWAKSADASHRALALDETLPDAYNALAGVKESYNDDAGAERDLQRAIELDPNYAEGRAHYAIHLSYARRFDESLAQHRIVLELEPLSVRYNYLLAEFFYWTRAYDRAVEQTRKALELDPNNPLAHELLGFVFEQKGMRKEAIAEWSRALTLTEDQELAQLLDRTCGASGFDAAVRALWRRKLERLDTRAKGGAYVPAMDFALAYTRLADNDQAFAWLAKAEQERNGRLGRARLDPLFDPLRADPRSRRVLEDRGSEP